MTKIHPSAFVHPKAELAADVEVGPFAYVGEHVKIGAGTKLLHHACVEGHTTMGKNNEVGSFSVIGGKPQDLKYKNEPTTLIIGDNNLFRENVTVNTGTVTGTGVTKMGSNCLIMAYAHIAHDCELGNNVIMSNYSGLSGHVTLGGLRDPFWYGGRYAVLPSRKHAFIGGMSGVDKNIAPYVIGVGNRLQIRGINQVGLRRRGFSPEQVEHILEAYKIFFDSGKEKAEALTILDEKFSNNPDVKYFADFIRNSTKPGIAR